MEVCNDLYAPETYWTASPEVRAQVCNGCGPGGWKLKLIPDTVLGLSVRECCNIHDWMYTCGRTIEDKDAADRAFLNNMLRLVNDATGFWASVLRYHRRLRVAEYYEAVHLFGGPAFWSGKNPTETLKGATK